jgi:hypothetical protein
MLLEWVCVFGRWYVHNEHTTLKTSFSCRDLVGNLPI